MTMQDRASGFRLPRAIRPCCFAFGVMASVAAIMCALVLPIALAIRGAAHPLAWLWPLAFVVWHGGVLMFMVCWGAVHEWGPLFDSRWLPSVIARWLNRIHAEVANVVLVAFPFVGATISALALFEAVFGDLEQAADLQSFANEIMIPS